MVFHWPLNRFVITASTIGMVGSSVCIGLLINSQYKVLKKPYCQLALEELQKNQAALNLIGAPIQINRPDLIDKSQKFEASFTDIKVPFEGSKKKGMLHLVADRKIDDNDWRLKRLEVTLDDMPGKMLLIYQRTSNDL